MTGSACRILLEAIIGDEVTPPTVTDKQSTPAWQSSSQSDYPFEPRAEDDGHFKFAFSDAATDLRKQKTQRYDPWAKPGCRRLATWLDAGKPPRAGRRSDI
eukprot:Skav217377  [mRNA]  locus=scaffold5994:53528:53830:- [translate_table: standard]